MKTYIEQRAVEIGHYIVENGATVRQTAKKFGVSKSTVHKDVTKGNVGLFHYRCEASKIRKWS